MLQLLPSFADTNICFSFLSQATLFGSMSAKRKSQPTRISEDKSAKKLQSDSMFLNQDSSDSASLKKSQLQQQQLLQQQQQLLSLMMKNSEQQQQAEKRSSPAGSSPAIELAQLEYLKAMTMASMAQQQQQQQMQHSDSFAASYRDLLLAKQKEQQRKSMEEVLKKLTGKTTDR